MIAPYDDRTLRLFLLDVLPEEERTAVELSTLESPELLERIEALEMELLLDFVQGRLSQEESQQVEAAYRQSPKRWSRVESMRALSEATARRSGLGRFHWLAAAAAILVAVGIGAFLLRKDSRGAEEDFAGKQQPEPLVVASIRLQPGLTRGVAEAASPSVLHGLDGGAFTASHAVARIHLSIAGLPIPQLGIWQVAVELVGADPGARSSGWRSEGSLASSSQEMVSIDVPVRQLPPGDYVIKLSRGGVAAASYQFRVDGK